MPTKRTYRLPIGALDGDHVSEDVYDLPINPGLIGILGPNLRSRRDGSLSRLHEYSLTLNTSHVSLTRKTLVFPKMLPLMHSALIAKALIPKQTLAHTDMRAQPFSGANRTGYAGPNIQKVRNRQVNACATGIRQNHFSYLA
jgi:hypothetical protein